MSTENISPPKRRRKRKKESKPKREVRKINLEKYACLYFYAVLFSTFRFFVCLHFLSFSVVFFFLLVLGLNPDPHTGVISECNDALGTLLVKPYCSHQTLLHCFPALAWLVQLFLSFIFFKKCFF